MKVPFLSHFRGFHSVVLIHLLRAVNISVVVYGLDRKSKKQKGKMNSGGKTFQRGKGILLQRNNVQVLTHVSIIIVWLINLVASTISTSLARSTIYYHLAKFAVPILYCNVSGQCQFFALSRLFSYNESTTSYRLCKSSHKHQTSFSCKQIYRVLACIALKVRYCFTIFVCWTFTLRYHI